MSDAPDNPDLSMTIKSTARELVDKAEAGDVEAARKILTTFSSVVSYALHDDGRPKHDLPSVMYAPDGSAIPYMQPLQAQVEGEYLAYLARCFTRFTTAENGGAKELFTAMRLKGKKRGPKPDEDKARAERVIAMLMLRHRFRLDRGQTTENITVFAGALAAKFSRATVHRRDYEVREIFTIERENTALAYSFFVVRRLRRNDRKVN